jgi:aminoglycoside/choline kinase family phosphotransferase
MMNIEEKISELYKIWSGKWPVSVTKMAGSGSYRSYYRMQGESGSVIGAHNEDARENTAFSSFTEHFRKMGLPVPEMLADDPDNRIYLISDLGDTTLYALLTLQRSASSEDIFPEEILEIYKKALTWLPVFQVKASKNLDYSVCYPRAAFDRQSMMWDLNYFKYYFLKLAKIPFDEQALEDDFSSLCDLLLEADSDFFLFRDFQSRNIMVVNDEPWFIDYQGGRKGALQYDVASLLTDGKADLPHQVRETLLQYYLEKLGQIYPVNKEEFLKTYYGFSLIRILQALGAYGFRGYYENKSHFLLSIPYALHNLRYLRSNNKIDFGLNTLMAVVDSMVDTQALYHQQSVEVENQANPATRALKDNPVPNLQEYMLTVKVQSFSYKMTIPQDESGNGGGFVFDCRALPNPGRYDEFKQLNGKDQPVIDFLSKETSVDEFLRNTFSLVDQSVRTYINRGFEHLMVSYGCTGGQHRSVYCAEKLAAYLKTKSKINVKLIHTVSNYGS